jgi:hypothetical protein
MKIKFIAPASDFVSTKYTPSQGHGSVYFSWFHDLFTMGALLTTVQRPIGQRQH